VVLVAGLIKSKLENGIRASASPELSLSVIWMERLFRPFADKAKWSVGTRYQFGRSGIAVFRETFTA
jgi:hypothetical protein